MKKNFLSFILLAVVMLFSSSILQAETKSKPILGEWLYEVSDAPYGYEKGSLIFSEKEGKTVCVVKVEAGELVASNLKIVKDIISFTTVVEGNPVNVELKLEKNKLSGKADSPEGPKTITAVRK
jgi:hypothetical protein